MFQFILKCAITLVIVLIAYFSIHKTWTSNIDILSLLKKPANMIPIKEELERPSNSEDIQQQILEENKKQTVLLEEMKRIRSKEHKRLMQEYPLGYAMFAITNGDEIITLDKSRLEERFEMDWNEAKIVKIKKNMIFMRYPRLVDKVSGCALLYPKDVIDGEIYKNVVAIGQWGLTRKLGVTEPIVYLGNTEICSEILVDNDSELIIVLGFKDNTQNTEDSNVIIISNIRKSM